MKLRRLALTTLFLLAGTYAGLGAVELTRLHSFGSGDSCAANPYSKVILGSDGALYGTTSAGGQAGQGTVFRMNRDGSGFQLIKTFGLSTNDGVRPFAAVLQGSDGALYGTTEEGGQFGFGTVFRIATDGSTFSVLKSFSAGSDGAYPEASLLEASDGMLYGTASGGGTNDSGVVFRLGKDGSAFMPLVQFNGTNGANPEAELLEASNGMLYGTTSSGSSTNLGSVFRLQKDGTGFAVLMSFLDTGTIRTNGAAPQSRLVEGTNGVLFGTAAAGGTNATGTIFQLNKDGTGFSTLYQFGTNGSTDGRIPLGDLILASDGMLYGTTFDGGTNGSGTVFRIGEDGTGYTVITSLGSPQGPAGGLTEATNGTLYGTTELGGDSGAGTVFTMQKDGSAFAVLKSFSSTGGDGQSPYAPPFGASNSLLYGTTRIGGSSSQGAVYEIRFDALGFELVSSLGGNSGSANPVGSLVEATNGNLYGVSQFGGGSNNGTIFSFGPRGTNLSLLYNSQFATNGVELRGGLIQASDGLLYGTTVYGGSGGDGVVFRVNDDGSDYSVLKTFAFGATGPGANPMEQVLEASDHYLYGTTYCGGISNKGVVYRLAKDGSAFAILKAFGSPATDGENPMSPLLEASDGMLYGTAYGGGATNNAGTVFHLNKDGTGFGVVRSFTSMDGDGRHPCGSLAEWSFDALYGTTERGGPNDQGTLFRVNKNGSGYAVLASFGGALGAYPRGGLVQGPDGALYGTTAQGGDMGFGTVFRYGSSFGDITDVGFINQIPTLTCLGLPGTNYVLEHTAQLGPLASWSAVSSTNAPANGQFSVTDQNQLVGAGQQQFYRLSR